MKVLFAALLALVLPCLPIASDAKSPGGKGGTTSVKGHTTKKGTYVAPHKRTAPDSSKRNNYSTKGNVNPYTGKKGTKDPTKK